MKKKRRTPIRQLQAIIDDIQGMVRNPEYRKDYFLWKEKEKHDLEIMLKYGIAFVVDPDLPLLKDLTMVDWDDLNREMTKCIEDEFRYFFVRKWAWNSVRIVNHDENRIAEGHHGKLCLDYKKRLRNERYLCIEIDLSKKKEYIMQEIEELVDGYSGCVTRESGRKTPGRVINRFLVWDQYIRLRQFEKIAAAHKCGASTVRKAYFRAFAEIMLEEYNRDKHNKKHLTKSQLRMTCDKCESRATCDTPCPEVLAFIDQDRKGKFSIASAARAKQQISPDRALENNDLLACINRRLGKTYTSLDDVNENLTQDEKIVLQRTPQIIESLRR